MRRVQAIQVFTDQEIKPLVLQEIEWMADTDVSHLLQTPRAARPILTIPAPADPPDSQRQRCQRYAPDSAVVLDSAENCISHL